MKRLLIALAALGIAGSASAQTLIAYWDENSNNLTSGAFGFLPTSFPQPASVGSGTLTPGNFVTELSGLDNAYASLPSFSGSTLNAYNGALSGGSFSPAGGTTNSSLGNNGMYFDLAVDLSGYENPILSWAQRGTSTGFSSRVISWSIDGTTFTPFATDTGTLSSTYAVVSYDFSAIDAIDGQSNVIFRVTLDGATSDSGNNRFDNLTVMASQSTSAVPEPSTFALIATGLGLAGFFGIRKKRT